MGKNHAKFIKNPELKGTLIYNHHNSLNTVLSRVYLFSIALKLRIEKFFLPFALPDETHVHLSQDLQVHQSS